MTDADKQSRSGKAQDKIKRQAGKSAKAGNIHDQFDTELAAMAGARVKEIRWTMNVLSVLVENGSRVSGPAWRVTGRNGNLHDQSRYASIRAKQTTLMAKSPSAAQLKDFEALEALLEKAAADDEKGAASAQRELKSWPKNPQIKSAVFERPNLIQLRFDGGMAIEFVGGIVGELSVFTPSHAFVVTDDPMSLR
jgi:hypothetical protein